MDKDEKMTAEMPLENIQSKNEEKVIEHGEDNTEQDSESVIRDDKGSDSDITSEDTNTNDEQIHINIENSNSQFYESSDSKINYAVKIDDNDTLSDVDDIKTDSASADSEDSALGSLPPDVALNDREEEAQDRCDGSDSGIGLETNDETKFPKFELDHPCTSGLIPKSSNEIDRNDVDSSRTNEELAIKPSIDSQPLKSSLKRKRESEGHESEDCIAPQPKKPKAGIRFDNVTVYYFPRAQGFSCVPSQGGSTLGMEWKHTHVENFTLIEHAMEQRRLHRQLLQQLKNERHSLEGTSFSSSEDSDTEEEASDISESELDLDSYYFLQPITTRQRRALLRNAGVRKIEAYEKDECRDIRTSREFCGCACKGVCNPETCSCSLAGIKCQVDRLNFPCGCTRDGCRNTTGRIEFNPVRVRTHFIHTLMRIGLEKKNEENQAAAKRQWAEAHAVSSSCISSNGYDRERCHSHEDGLLRDVSLSPRVEVETCVNGGSFSNVHCDMTNNICNHSTNMQNHMNYRYRDNAANHRNVNENNAIHMGESSTHANHGDAYPPSILQGKGPPYTVSNNINYNNMSHNVQSFSCDLSYSYNQHAENQHFKNAQSYNASSFEEFAHNSHMNMFSHYGHMYVPDYMQKQHNMSMLNHNAMHHEYHQMSQTHYDVYKNSNDAITENKCDQHYNTMMPYHSNKLQAVENDENWFSHNTLLNLDQTEQATQDACDVTPQPVVQPSDINTEETDNFGELIKKSMVESVSV